MHKAYECQHTENEAYAVMGHKNSTDMTSKTITQALREAAAGIGYSFCSGFDYRMQETIKAYPCLWLSPPKITAVKGRSEGRIRYRAAMHLMKLSGKAGGAQREEICSALEEDALAVYRSLAQDGRISAWLVECSPAEFSLTNHGEISVSLKMDIDVPFCNL